MKKKVGTILEEDLIVAAKRMALSKKITLSQLFEEALRNFIKLNEKKAKKGMVSKHTKGAIKISPKILKLILEEDNFYEN